MKKRNNKTIILIIIGVLFVVLFTIFILNYSKDSASYSILEKKWINDNANEVIDVSVFNDVPVYGKNGHGVIFDMLDEFSLNNNINFNKVSYLTSNSNNSYKDVSFRILNGDVDLSDNDILLYSDNYVLITNLDNITIDRISDIKDINIGLLQSDIGLISNYLSDAINVSFTPKDNIDNLILSFNNNEFTYALLPYNMYLDTILENDFNIIYHLSDVNKKYVLTIENNNTFLNIMKKFYNGYSVNGLTDSYKENYLKAFFDGKSISEADRMGYNSASYNIGCIDYMPYTGKQSKELIGTISNYINKFEDTFDLDFKIIFYDNIEKLRNDLSSGILDMAFANFDTSNLNIDTLYTSSLFREEYVVLSKDKFVVNSIKSLNKKEVLVLKDSYIYDMVRTNNIKFAAYDDIDKLIRKAGSDSIVVIDNDTYEYYKNAKFSDFNKLYTGKLPYEYRFVVRDVDKNKTLYSMVDFYTSSINYEEYRFSYNTNSKVYDYGLLVGFLVTVLAIILAVFIIFIFKKKNKKNLVLLNNDKLRYIDTMTSLKNRAYLNSKIKEWDDNVIYPQGFIVIDLNNIKYINDNHGHEAGDMVIKKAASTLIVNQEPNTDIIRTDGTEFLIYTVGYSEKDIINYVRKIYKELMELPYGYGAVIGYSMIMDDVKTVDDAINEATIDMRNKKGSKNNG